MLDIKVLLMITKRNCIKKTIGKQIILGQIIYLIHNIHNYKLRHLKYLYSHLHLNLLINKLSPFIISLIFNKGFQFKENHTKETLYKVKEYHIKTTFLPYIMLKSLLIHILIDIICNKDHHLEIKSIIIINITYLNK